MAAGYPPPPSRPLRVLPFDPMTDRRGRVAVIDITYEKLGPPIGRLVEVVDYDASTDHQYESIDFEHSAVVVAGGLAPDESDPRFHQQMVYAVSMRVLETFERGLGRPFRWRGDRRLRIYPHAFEKRNAYFDPDLGEGGALVFGYFEATEEDPGENIPGQTIFTCLSHSIIAHETTHAVIHRLRPDYMSPTNPDVRAFHEGVSDIIAYLVPFTYRDVVLGEIARVRSDLDSGSPLLQLAQQFGYAKGDGEALRAATEHATINDYANATTPHARGQVLASAVMDGFRSAYRRASSSVIGLATGGAGLPEQGELHPDLAAEVSRAATKSATRILNMSIRALDYLPPVDVTFSDYLRALVTADADLYPADAIGLRAGLIESFRKRGIYPEGVISLAERSIRYDAASERDFPPEETMGLLDPEFLMAVANEFDRRADLRTKRVEERIDDLEKPEEYARIVEQEEGQVIDDAGLSLTTMQEAASAEVAARQARKLHTWATQHHEALELDIDVPIRVAGFNSSQRTDDDGYSRTIVSIQFTQQLRPEGEDESALGGLPIKGGTTVIADSEGTVRYVIAKPLPKKRQRRQHIDGLKQMVADLEHEHPELAWDDDPDRIKKFFSLRRIDDGRL